MEHKKHKHHIIPKHAGGSDDPSNLIELTVEEHAEAHRKLYEEHGRWQDKVAWKALSGMIGKEDVIKEVLKNVDKSYTQTDSFRKTMSRSTKQAWVEGKKVAHSGWNHTEDFKEAARERAVKSRTNDWPRGGPGR